MKRQIVFGVSGSAVVFATLGIAFGWWLRGPPPETARALSVPPPPPAADLPIWRAPEAPEAPEAPIAPLPEPGRVTAHETALRAVAEYTGDGVVRCSVGDTVPDGPISGLTRGRVERGLLVGSVEDPNGQAKIQLPADRKSDPPRLVVRWSGVYPGETGSCEVLRPQRVAVTGRVVDAAGLSAGVVEVGNLVEGTIESGPDGRFVAACWRGAECPLAARRSIGAGWGPFVTLVPDGPVSGVELVLDAPGPAQSMQSTLEEWVAEDERVEQQPDPLKLALADPDLSAEAHTLIEGWLQEELDQRQMLRTALAEVTVALR